MTKQKLIEELKDELTIATGVYARLYENFKLDESPHSSYERGYACGQTDILEYILERLEELE